MPLRTKAIRPSRWIFYLVSFGSLLLALNTIWLIYRYGQAQADWKRQAFAYAEEQAVAVTHALNAEMEAQIEIANNLAGTLSGTDVASIEILPILQQTITQHPDVFGVFVAFEPYRYRENIELYAPYVRKNEHGEFTVSQIENSYDYTDATLPEANWHQRVIESKAPAWVSLYGSASHDFVILYAIPVVEAVSARQQDVVGVIGVVHTIDTFSTAIKQVDLGEDGYVALIDAESTLVMHPKPEFINKSGPEIAALMDEPALLPDFERANQGEAFYRERNAAAGKSSWTFYKPLLARGWSALTLMFTDVRMPQPEHIIRQRTHIGISAMAFAVFLALAVFRVDRGQLAKLWAIAIVVTLTFLSGIAWIWHLTLVYPRRPDQQNLVMSHLDVQSALSQVDTFNLARNQLPPERIPTGILVQNLEINADQAVVAGYIWQKYPQQFSPVNIQPPQFTDQVNRAEFDEVYRFSSQDKTVVGWHFSVTVAQNFELKQFPLDQVTIKLNLDPGILDQNIVLVPDFEEYEFMVLNLRPGVAKGVAVPGWRLGRSYFCYNLQANGVGMGAAEVLQQSVKPRLCFSINASRELLSPLVSYGIVIVLVAMQLFGLLAVKIDVNFHVLSIASALFFIAAITHTDLRKNLAIGTTTYFEYFFIVLYVMIVLSAILKMLSLSGYKVPLMTYKNNLLVKILFWPGFFGVIWIITMIFLYPH